MALPQEGFILPCIGCSPDSVIAPAGQAAVAAPRALAALRHKHSYEPTAEALAQHTARLHVLVNNLSIEANRLKGHMFLVNTLWNFRYLPGKTNQENIL